MFLMKQTALLTLVRQKNLWVSLGSGNFPST